LDQDTHPTIILIRGLPGSGKTYIAKELQKTLGLKNAIMLDPDATDYKSEAYKQHTKKLTQEGVDPKIHAYRFLRAKAYQGIADHKIILWNQPFTNLEIFNKMVANLKIQADEHKTELTILVVEVEIDHSIAKNRVNLRKHAGGHGPSDNTFKRFINDYTSFAPHGYKTVTVNGEDDVNKSINSIMKALRSL
jgi:tRNA uridine 5-carbamoylmethylation protein Kti12